MCQSSQQQFSAVTGTARVTQANGELDGSGTLNLLLTAGANGTVVKTITIKAFASNEQGMVRFFIRPKGSGEAILWKEVPVPANTQSPTVPAYQTTVRASFMLEPDASLMVTTQNAEKWMFIAEGVNWENCPCG